MPHPGAGPAGSKHSHPEIPAAPARRDNWFTRGLPVFIEVAGGSPLVEALLKAWQQRAIGGAANDQMLPLIHPSCHDSSGNGPPNRQNTTVRFIEICTSTSGIPLAAYLEHMRGRVMGQAGLDCRCHLGKRGVKKCSELIMHKVIHINSREPGKNDLIMPWQSTEDDPPCPASPTRSDTARITALWRKATRSALLHESMSTLICILGSITPNVMEHWRREFARACDSRMTMETFSAKEREAHQKRQKKRRESRDALAKLIAQMRQDGWANADLLQPEFPRLPGKRKLPENCRRGSPAFLEEKFGEELRTYANLSWGPQQRLPMVEKPLAQMDIAVKVALSFSDEKKGTLKWWTAEHCYMCGGDASTHNPPTAEGPRGGRRILWTRCTQCNSPICTTHRRFICAADLTSLQRGGKQCFCSDAEACYKRRLVIQGVMEEHPWVDIQE